MKNEKKNIGNHWHSFPLKISSLNVTKFAVCRGFVHIYSRNPEWKTPFLCSGIFSSAELFTANNFCDKF